MSDTHVIGIDGIKRIFFGKNLVEFVAPGTPKTIRMIKTDESVDKPSLSSNMTPSTRAIYDSLTPREQSMLLSELEIDDADIARVNYRVEDLDPDYAEKIDGHGIGVMVENYVVNYGVCPVCQQHTLRKYQHTNVPVVDLVCINYEKHIHDETCFLYQVKASVSDEYFNKRRKCITVGSRIYGETSHSQYSDSDFHHRCIVPGYICIKLKENSADLGDYMIDNKSSFVLVPKYQPDKHLAYYQYLNATGYRDKALITWSESVVETIPINSVLRDSGSFNVFHNENAIINPYHILISES